MNVVYTLKNGVKLSTFLWSDMMEKTLFRNEIEIRRIRHNKMGKPIKKKLFQDEHDLFFIWDGKKVYVNEYDYMPVSEMVEYIKQERTSRSGWFEDKLFATIMRDTDNVGILFDLPIYDMFLRDVGVRFSSGEERKVLCIPFEEPAYPKNRWAYKFSIHTANPDYRSLFHSRNFYFSDFAQHVLHGTAEIVVKDEFVKEQEELLAKQNTFKNKLIRFFVKAKESQRIYI